MHFIDNCLSEFRKSLKYPIPGFLRIDELGRIAAWPLVLVLSKLNIRAELVVVASFLSNLVASLDLPRGVSFLGAYGVAFFIFLRIIFDCADGMLARYTNTVTASGASLDLISDFFNQTLLFFAISRYLILHTGYQPLLILILTTISLSAHLLSATIVSFISFQKYSDMENFNDIKNVFLRGPINTNKRDAAYKILSFIYFYTWKPFTSIALAIFRSNTKLKISGIEEHIYASAGIGTSLLFLILTLLSGISMIWFLLWHILVLALIATMLSLKNVCKD